MPSLDPGFVEPEVCNTEEKEYKYKNNPFRSPGICPYKSSAAHKAVSGVSHSDVHNPSDSIQDPFADWSPKLWKAPAFALDLIYRKDLY